MKHCLTILYCSVLCLALMMVALPLEAQTPADEKSDPEIVFWETVRDSNDAEMYNAYLQQYPNGHFADLAKIKIKSLAGKGSYPLKQPAAVQPAEKAAAPATHIKLRSKPEKILGRDIKAAIQKYNFSIPKRNPDGDFKNQFVDNLDGTITDEATGLVWQTGHSYRRLNRYRAKKYIAKLNWERFGGRTGWRIPTLEELVSLMEGKPMKPLWLHYDPVFHTPDLGTPDRFWSSDGGEKVWQLNRHAWIVDFWKGKITEAAWKDGYSSSTPAFNEINYVRAVCTK